MLLVFNDDGSVEFTRKPEALKLFEGERKDIVRMTDIIFDEDYQRFHIKWLTGPFAGKYLDLGQLIDIVPTDAKWPGNNAKTIHEEMNSWITSELAWDTAPGTSMCPSFETYEDAVVVEVRIVDEMRKLGMRLVA